MPLDGFQPKIIRKWQFDKQIETATSWKPTLELSPSVTAQITVDEYGAQSKSLTEAPSSKLKSGAEPALVDQIFNVQSWKSLFMVN